MFRFHNVYEVDIVSGEHKLLLTNRRFSDFLFDNNLRLRLAGEKLSNGSIVYYRSMTIESNKTETLFNDSNIDDNDEYQWQHYVTINPEDLPVTRPVGFTANNSKIYWIWSVNGNFGYLFIFYINQIRLLIGQLTVHQIDDINKKQNIYNPHFAEIDYVLLHPTDRTVLSLLETYHQPEIIIINQTIADDYQYLKHLKKDAIPIVSSFSQGKYRIILQFIR